MRPTYYLVGKVEAWAYKMKISSKLLKEQKGAAFLAYALLVALIACIAIASVEAVGGKVADVSCKASGSLEYSGHVSGEWFFNKETGECDVKCPAFATCS